MSDVFETFEAARDLRQTRGYNDEEGLLPQRTPSGALPFRADRLLPPRRRPDDIQHIFDGARYGDFIMIPVAANISTASPALDRAQGVRTFLEIDNNDNVLPMFVAFGGPASSSFGIKINPGGARIFDVTVPQNEIYISGGAVGTLVYCNGPSHDGT